MLVLGDRHLPGLEQIPPFFNSRGGQLMGAGDGGPDRIDFTGALPDDDRFMASSSESRPPNLVANSLFR